jgi:hypothetical protein
VIKDVITFIQWQWNKFEFWQRCFIFSSFFFGAALVAEPPYVFYFTIIPMVVVFGFMFKWFFIEPTVKAWNKYQEEKTQLFATIKESEK